MADATRIRFGGYGPPETAHSRAASVFKDALDDQSFDVDLFWNVLDFGYQASDLMSMVESGLLTLCYFSTSYLAGRVPGLEIIDLPFLFRDIDHAHNALDGPLGDELTRRTEEQTGYRVLGYWDNGFRHLSNSLHPVRTPDDCHDLRIRLQPNDVHIETFRRLGADPVPCDLADGIAMIQNGDVNAQENPLANIKTYGVHEYQRHITMSAHFYGARGLYMNKDAYDTLPSDLQGAVLAAARKAIDFQRTAAAQAEADIRRDFEDQGIEFVDLTDDERQQFIDAVAPVNEQARASLGDDLFALAQ
jgi:tripartite ATP-independent transporter DctP family solute receptor